jgi:hypothetical protein
MSHLINMINPMDKIDIGTFLTDKIKKASNKHRSMLLGEKASLNIEQDFMITPDLDKGLKSAIKGKIYEESY